jgi:hypothetical protein
MTNDGAPLEVWIAIPGALGTDEAPGVGFADSNEVEQQARRLAGRLGDAVTVDSGEFLASWQKAVKAVEAVFAANDGSSGTTFWLESVTARLSLTAKGKVAFIAELGGEVAFEATFKRRT